MNRCIPWIMAGFVLAVSQPAGAGGKKKDGPPQPGAEHKILAGLEGSYTSRVKVFRGPGKAPEESTGTLTRKLILDGRYLKENHEGKAADKAFAGLGLLGFDLTRKKYVLAWVDNSSTGIMFKEGDYDAGAKTLTFLDEFKAADGSNVRIRDVLKIVNANEQLFETFQQVGKEKEIRVLEVRYTRKKT